LKTLAIERNDTLNIFTLGTQSTFISFYRVRLIKSITIPASSIPTLDFTNSSVRFVSMNHVEISRVDEGLLATIDFSSDSSTTSFKDQALQHFYLSSISPNPASLSIKADIGKFGTANRTGLTLQLCAMGGWIEKDFTLQIPQFSTGRETHTITLDISDVASGPYLLVIKNSQSTDAVKVMVVR